jgi:methylglutaconyl-CoA hydratase
MQCNYINIQIDGSGIALLTLNRPDKHNAFDDSMIKAMIEALEKISYLKNIHVIILKAAGKSFSSGADLDWMRQMINYSAAQNLADAALLAKLMQLLYRCPQTTLALAQGAVYGGGVGLIACCDIVLAADTATFCLSEVKLGLIPAIISPYIIRAIGERQARRYFLTAEVIESKQAAKLGLVHELAPESMLFERGYQLAKNILQNEPKAVKAAKHLLQTISGQPIDEKLIQKTVDEIATIRVSAEAQKRLRLFLGRTAK